MFVFIVQKVIFLKVVSPLMIFQHTKFHGVTLTGTVFTSTSEIVKTPQSPYSKAPLKKTAVKIKLVGMSMSFHFTKRRLSKFNGS
jgi:hypothetical protein